jgi:hypothetical protein
VNKPEPGVNGPVVRIVGANGDIMVRYPGGETRAERMWEACVYVGGPFEPLRRSLCQQMNFTSQIPLRGR